MQRRYRRPYQHRLKARDLGKKTGGGCQLAGPVRKTYDMARGHTSVSHTSTMGVGHTNQGVILMKNSFFLLFLFVATGLVGCASDLSGESYSRSEARTVQQVEYGSIEHLRPVKIEGTKTPIGSGAGAAVGGIAGSSVGGGKGSYIMTVIGAVAGGMAGAAIEEGVTRAHGVEITVKLDSGQTIAIVQELSPNERFSVGERVRVLYAGQNTRVSH